MNYIDHLENMYRSEDRKTCLCLRSYGKFNMSDCHNYTRSNLNIQTLQSGQVRWVLWHPVTMFTSHTQKSWVRARDTILSYDISTGGIICENSLQNYTKIGNAIKVLMLIFSNFDKKKRNKTKQKIDIVSTCIWRSKSYYDMYYVSRTITIMLVFIQVKTVADFVINLFEYPLKKTVPSVRLSLQVKYLQN